MRIADSVTFTIEEVAKVTALLNDILDKTEEGMNGLFEKGKHSQKELERIEDLCQVHTRADKIYKIINERTQKANRAATKLEV